MLNKKPGKLIIYAASAVLCLGFWVLSLSMFLHTQEIFIISRDKIPVENFTHAAGHAWYAKFARNSFTSPSRAVLLENGLPLRCGNSGTDTIAYVGGGRYYLSNDELLFSASDNSDPATNGRRYELLSATYINRDRQRLTVILAVLSTALLIVLSSMGYAGDFLHPLDAIKTYAARNKRTVDVIIATASFTIPTAAFLITRLPYFLYYPVVLIRSDSYGYFDVAVQIISGTWPELSLRTPGYPLFIALVFLFSKKILSVIVMQNLLSLLSALTFVYGIVISYRYFAPLAAIGMAAFITSHVQMAGDISLLSESLYVSVIVFAYAFLTIALKRGRGVFFALSGAAFAYTVYVRPAGLFVVAVFISVIVYLWINGRSRRTIAVFAAPFLSMLLMLCTYNYITLRSFAIDNHSGEVAVILNSIFLERDDRKYTRELNAAIEKIRSYASPEERALLNSTWDIKKYNETIDAIYNRGGGDGGITGPISEALGNRSTEEMKRVLRTLLFDTIEKHPLEFMKKFLVFLVIYFDNAGADSDVYNSINGSYSSLYITEEGGGTALMRYLKPHPLPHFTEETAVHGGLTAHAGEYAATNLQWFHYFIYTKLHRAIFRNWFWPASFIIAFVLSAVCLIRSGWKNMGAFILFAMGSAVLLHAIGVAATAFPNPRYSYTMEFGYYLLPLLLPGCYYKRD
ncbi:MAG: hypothetical protein HQK99_14650 [Nitrospirae bacterium]|nr:hypothetical protein [Nitrospirota bacterium]